MAQSRVERRLAAILAADVAGYSRLTGLDEEGTHAQLTDHLRSFATKITEHRGRVVKSTGDGLLADFSSVVDAVRCAVDVQRGMVQRNSDVPQEKRIEFRIGINVGDIIIDRGDIFGDGVNVATRLESLAEPGGICVSSRVKEDAEGKLEIIFENAGEQHLKNIERPVHVYRVQPSSPVSSRPTLALPDKPSIAVLPFENMSGDAEQEYFADGMVDEIITALSRFRSLFVIARNSTFTYKGRSVDVKQAGRELGVRYVLKGGVRKAANRVRIIGQLIDTTTGAHIWADRFEGGLEDAFDLQDRVTASVVGAIAPKLELAEIERAKRKPTESLDAYDYYLRGLARTRHWSKEANSEALQMFYKAIGLDPDFASAHGMAAWCHAQRKGFRWVTNRSQEIADTTRLARRAAELGRDDAVALGTGGWALALVAGDLDDAAAFIDRALALNPNLATTWQFSGWVRVWLGEPEVAVEHFAIAMRLSPLDPLTFVAQGGTAFAHIFAGCYDLALSWAQKAVRERPNWPEGQRLIAAAAALSGRSKEAQQAIARMREMDPNWRLSNIRRTALFRRPEDHAKYVEALQKAGLPE
ncbi:MAG: adenylate/guanylate cyclase domain-containing protein [Pseudolabrys sp.]